MTMLAVAAFLLAVDTAGLLGSSSNLADSAHEGAMHHEIWTCTQSISQGCTRLLQSLRVQREHQAPSHTKHIFGL